jgi:hypothetical protein
VPHFWSMSDRELERKIIEHLFHKGRRWIVWGSALSWGCIMFLFMTALDFIRRPRQQFSGTEEVLWLLFSLLLWITGGYAVGEGVWRSVNKHKR